jgi:hypothetical protein
MQNTIFLVAVLVCIASAQVGWTVCPATQGSSLKIPENISVCGTISVPYSRTIPTNTNITLGVKVLQSKISRKGQIMLMGIPCSVRYSIVTNSNSTTTISASNYITY